MFSRTQGQLRQKIDEILATKHAVVGVAVTDHNGKEIVSVNGRRHFPLQSVFKFHIALAMLSQVDKGTLSLDQKVTIAKGEMLPHLYSPIRDKYPDGVTLKLSEILEYTVSQSDNVGCDVLLRLIGGPKAVEDYLAKHGFKGVSIKINEETQQATWDAQFQNWTTPRAANVALIAAFSNTKHLLSKTSYDFLWRVMRETQTGAGRLRGQLPENTVVAHKTGSSGTNKQGLTAAANDIGVVFLPNGQRFFISVFVTDSTETPDTNDKIIAAMAKAAWDFFETRPK